MVAVIYRSVISLHGYKGGSMTRPGILCALAFAIFLVQSNGQNFGEFTGVVEDATGAVITGATVTILNTDTGQTRQVQTNTAGSYSLPYLVPGTYDIRAETSGFKTASRRSVLLDVGAVMRVD